MDFRADRLKTFGGDTVWGEFTPLAAECKAVNLGQGFPDWNPPAFVVEALNEAVKTPAGNQYCRSAGNVDLVKELASLYEEKLGREIDPLKNVAITVGSTEALFATMQSFVSPGDEVVIMEPAFDLYAAHVTMAGGKAVKVPIVFQETENAKDSCWAFDRKNFADCITEKTRVVLINSPHNPLGKIFSKDDLQFIADCVLAQEKCIVMADEVYEYMTFDGNSMIHMAAIPGMWDRTVTISSAGKTFSVTGWKIGWCIAPAHLCGPIQITQQWVQFSVSTPCQVAIANVIRRARQPYEGHPTYFSWLSTLYDNKRVKLMQALQNAGLEPISPQGGFFIMVNTEKVSVPQKYLDEPNTTRDYAFCRWLTRDIGVCAIPPTAFCADDGKKFMQNFARFAFCKSDEAIEEAGKRLLSLKQ